MRHSKGTHTLTHALSHAPMLSHMHLRAHVMRVRNAQYGCIRVSTYVVKGPVLGTHYLGPQQMSPFGHSPNGRINISARLWAARPLLFARVAGRVSRRAGTSSPDLRHFPFLVATGFCGKSRPTRPTRYSMKRGGILSHMPLAGGSGLAVAIYTRKSPSRTHRAGGAKGEREHDGPAFTARSAAALRSSTRCTRTDVGGCADKR